jgi:16S rRNA (adenine1518-N6/adenine1519-N6)-dimethyltransferase
MTQDVATYLKEHGINPSKKLGQNFLINQDICDKIVDNVDFDKTDCVVEIGPGLGALTQTLIGKSPYLITIELDKRLYDYNKKTFNKIKNIEMINDDVLNVDFDALAEKYKTPVIVSNLPYAISSLVVIKFIKATRFKEMYVMLQKEMVERILAKTKTKKYNNLTVLINQYASVEKLLSIGRNNFYPIPAVDSIVIKLTRNKNTYEEKFDKFTKLCFAAKRRTLVNNLKNIIEKQDLIDFLKLHKLPIDVRAE